MWSEERAMSRAVRKQLLSTADLLKQGNQALAEQISDGQSEEKITGLLADMQETAICMGNFIEQIYGEGTATVKELETYCELLYQMTTVLGSLPEERDLLKQLEDQTEHICARIEREIPDRLEVVFLPYKASMWDSLESIWRAAKEDEEADVRVIPIPYFDRNPDRSFRNEYYEGDQFPEDVEITDYRTYDLELRKPDMIFIHNPYDDMNQVTSVHPYYYCANLKKFTEKLVYVPYFVCSAEIVPEGMALTNGVWYADYVIVLNESEKEQYARNFQKHFPELDISDKLLPLGSPKLDKVHAVCRGEVSVPESWKERAKGKKVILYNTSLKAMLTENEAYLDKMERVFRFFASQKEALLLWRPHPLMDSTFSSVRPRLYERYRRLRDYFIREEIGIYDDAPDMYPAMALSDAYYGDWSSLVRLYRETGKPVMIQDVRVE